MQHEAFSVTDAGTSATFNLVLGGHYLFTAKATWGSGGTVAVQRLAPDGSTYVDILAAYDASAAEQNEPINTLGANGALIIPLAPGAYQLTITTATAVYAEVARIPLC